MVGLIPRGSAIDALRASSARNLWRKDAGSDECVLHSGDSTETARPLSTYNRWDVSSSPGRRRMCCGTHSLRGRTFASDIAPGLCR